MWQFSVRLLERAPSAKLCSRLLHPPAPYLTQADILKRCSSLLPHMPSPPTSNLAVSGSRLHIAYSPIQLGVQCTGGSRSPPLRLVDLDTSMEPCCYFTLPMMMGHLLEKAHQPTTQHKSARSLPRIGLVEPEQVGVRPQFLLLTTSLSRSPFEHPMHFVCRQSAGFGPSS